MSYGKDTGNEKTNTTKHGESNESEWQGSVGGGGASGVKTLQRATVSLDTFNTFEFACATHSRGDAAKDEVTVPDGLHLRGASAVNLRRFIGCAVREFTFLAKKPGCRGMHITTDACWGRCETWEKPVVEPPYIESHQRVCTYNETRLVTVKLPHCQSSVDPTYTYPVALRRVMKNRTRFSSHEQDPSPPRRQATSPPQFELKLNFFSDPDPESDLCDLCDLFDLCDCEVERVTTDDSDSTTRTNTNENISEVSSASDVFI
ncbi:hypothetical protein F2P81_003374 [Scophthalmus maximus]|uniref:Glycoprotein hormone beta-5 n=1 Tax=Scophthalmus maximus TaxID=52904 RepID=A0A6A4T9G7_SCOMX|nr:hypothetical protein F2P81_003374 [Scophthalmus maximus]